MNWGMWEGIDMRKNVNSWLLQSTGEIGKLGRQHVRRDAANLLKKRVGQNDFWFQITASRKIEILLSFLAQKLSINNTQII